jgi:YD repeat-containing protein
MILEAAPAPYTNDQMVIRASTGTSRHYAGALRPAWMREGMLKAALLEGCEDLEVVGGSRRQDNLRRRVLGAQHQTSLSTPLGNTTTDSYTGGLLTSATDPLGRVSRYGHDQAGRPVETIGPRTGSGPRRNSVSSGSLAASASGLGGAFPG